MPDARPDCDALLLAQCACGDECAWRELYRAHSRRVARFVAAVVGPRQDVDDLVQQVFVEVLAAARTFRGEARFSTWLFGIASHVASRHVRGEVRWRLRREAAAADADDGAWPDPARGLEAREALAVVESAVRGLDVAHRIVWVMREVEGLPGEEVAVALGVPEGTVRSRLFHARRAVTGALEAAGFGSCGTRGEVVALPAGQGRAAG